MNIMNTGLIVVIVVAVAVVGFVMTRKKEDSSSPEPTSQPQPKPAPVATQSEKPTLVMSPQEAQQAADESMASTKPTVMPEGKTEEPTPTEAVVEEPQAAASSEAEPEESQAATESEAEVASTTDPSEAETQLAPVEGLAALDNPEGGNAVLCILDVAGSELSVPNRSTLSAAQQIAKARGAELHVCCLGDDTSSASQASAEGVTAVHTITHASLGDGIAESYFAAAMTALGSVAADVIVGPSSSIGKGYLPRLAEQLDSGMVTEILSVESGDTFTRALWAGSVIATVQGTGRLVVSVRATGFEPAATQATEPKEIAFEAPATKTRFIGRETTESARPDLSEASVVVSGGRGTKGDFAPIEQLADALGAAMGASRAACDAGWVPNDLQVGQTGKVVAPSLYIAAGLSGAIQHIAGMKGSKTIVAINKDEEAPIFGVADYGLVADLFEVCPELADKVGEQGLKPTA